MNNDYMLTTYDNPLNPFDDFAAWWKYDVMILGHDCCGLLAKEARTSEVFSDDLNQRRVYEAMDRIISESPLIFRKVTKQDYVMAG